MSLEIVHNCLSCGDEILYNAWEEYEEICINCRSDQNLQQPLVHRVEFEDKQISSNRAIGQYVSHVDPLPPIDDQSTDYNITTVHSDNDTSVNRARNILNQIASHCSLNLDPNIASKALIYYRMALQRGITRSRCILYITVSCLYIVCRLNETGHPTLFVERYGFKLKLGENTRDICHTAVRLIGRMKRDWIHLGRRPNGLCGAALLVAAQLRGINISVQRMVNTVKISKSVLLKRMTDFGNTPSSQFTLEDLFTSRIETQVEQDPPSFIKSRENYLRRSTFENEHGMLDKRVIEMVERTQHKMDVIMGIREVIQLGIDSSQNSKQEIASNNETKVQSFTNDESSQQNIVFHDKIIEHFDASYTHQNETNLQVYDDHLSDVDDDEINAAVLSSTEVDIKTKIWEAENAEYLKSREEKNKLKERILATKKKRKSKGPRRKKTGLSKDLKDHLISGAPLPSEDGGNTIDSEEDATLKFIDLILDRRRSEKNFTMDVPVHIQEKYDHMTTSPKNDISSEPIKSRNKRQKSKSIVKPETNGHGAPKNSKGKKSKTTNESKNNNNKASVKKKSKISNIIIKEDDSHKRKVKFSELITLTEVGDRPLSPIIQSTECPVNKDDIIPEFDFLHPPDNSAQL